MEDDGTPDRALQAVLGDAWAAKPKARELALAEELSAKLAALFRPRLGKGAAPRDPDSR